MIAESEPTAPNNWGIMSTKEIRKGTKLAEKGKDSVPTGGFGLKRVCSIRLTQGQEFQMRLPCGILPHLVVVFVVTLLDDTG